MRLELLSLLLLLLDVAVVVGGRACCRIGPGLDAVYWFGWFIVLFVLVVLVEYPFCLFCMILSVYITSYPKNAGHHNLYTLLFK